MRIEMAKLKIPARVLGMQAVVSRPPRQKNKQTPPKSKFKGLTSSQIRKLKKEN